MNFGFRISIFGLIAQRELHADEPHESVLSRNPQSRGPHPQFAIRKPQFARTGITLLEVLISMFIMLVGLLGLASLLTVGKHLGASGTKADRASTCGRAAFREMQVRGFLDPRSWALATASGHKVLDPISNNFAWNVAQPTTYVPEFGAFAIDPLGVGDATSAQSFGHWFPYDSSATPTMKRIPRITLGPGAATAARTAVADAVFRWQDDLTFETPSNADNLPAQVLQGDARRLSTGDYSWLATVAPDPGIINPDPYYNHKPFGVPLRVSVAVFHKRDLGTAGAGERVCTLAQPTGNGETQLTVETADIPASYSGDGVKFLTVKPKQWLMVACCPDTSVPYPSWFYSWQRIVSVDSVVPNGTAWTCAITLAGPDQQFFTDAASVNLAYLFDGVVAVYEKNMTLEQDSMY